MSNVFIALQKNEETRAIVNAIMADNPDAILKEQPAMVKVDCPNRLVIKRESVEQEMGRDFDLQVLHVNLITLSGHIDEDEDQFALHWGN